MQELHWLSDRLNVLLKKYAALQTENRGLKSKLARKEEEVASLGKKLAAAEEQMAAVEIGRALPDKKDRERVRKQLDSVIGEIDKILNTLND